MPLFDGSVTDLLSPLLDALDSRLDLASGEAERLFHGRGHCFPGLEAVTLDWLPPVLLVTLFAPLPDELQSRLVAHCRRRYPQLSGLAIQRRFESGAPTELAYGSLPDQHVVTEGGLRFGLKLGRNQNTGLFLDMREGRRWVREQAQGRRVLNLFAYTCAFSVAAVAGEARRVVNLDMSRGALEQGRSNHRLNAQDTRDVHFLPHELFRSWGKVRKLGPYDLVIIDPPSFQKGSFVATKDYQRVLRRLPELLAPGAEVLACLNDPAIGPEYLIEQMATLCPECRFVERLANPASFPEADAQKGLKVMRFAYAGDGQERMARQAQQMQQQ